MSVKKLISNIGQRRAQQLRVLLPCGALALLVLFATLALSRQRMYNTPHATRPSSKLPLLHARVSAPPMQLAAEPQPCPAVAPPLPLPPAPRRLPAPRGSHKRKKPLFRLPWKPHLRQEDVQRGLAYWGTGGRLQAVAAKLLAGQPIKAVALGGSVTYGNGASSPERAYPGRFFEFINATFPHRDHVLLNKGMGATGSGLFAACLRRMVPEDLDLAIVEFTVNDAEDVTYDSAERRGYEQLLRKLLRLPSRPAVLQLHHHRWYHVPEGSNDIERGVFYHTTGEAQLLVFAQYYDFPAMSVRAALHPLMRANVTGFRVDRVLDKGWKTTLGGRIPRAPTEDARQYFYWDKSHPTDVGHAALAELLAAALLRAAAEAASPADALAAAGLGAWQGGSRLEGGTQAQHAQRAQLDLPPPMIPGNADTTTTLCAIQEDFEAAIVASSGFQYRPEKPQAAGRVAQKWAWTGLRPGDWAEMEFDSRVAASPDEPNTGAGSSGGTASSATSGGSSTTSGGSGSSGTGGGGSGAEATVYLVHLKSYEGMGTALVECVSGCACARHTLDGTWSTPSSLQQMRKFTVSQHRRCRVRVTVRSQAGEVAQRGHKVALMGLLVSHYPLKLSTSQHGSMELMWQRTGRGT